MESADERRTDAPAVPDAAAAATATATAAGPPTSLGDDMPEPEPFTFDAEAAANVSSAIMFRLPTKALAPLRVAFECSDRGLNLVEFLEAFVRNMDLDENVDELLRTIPDLLDFFKSVDINGDGKMEWSEFVAFVIESVVSADPPVLEKFVNVARHGVQPAGQRQTVKVSKMLPQFNRLFIGVGAQIIILEADDKSETWMSSGVRVHLIARDSSGQAAGSTAAGAVSSELTETDGGSGGGGGKGAGVATVSLVGGGKKKEKEKETGPRTRPDNRLQQALSALDFVYLTAREMLIVLRSDICLEFHKFMNRSKIHPDFILQNGVWPLTQPYNKLALRETRLAPWRLFAVGENRKTIDSWMISVNVSGAVELSDYQALEKHTDFLRDILVIHTDMYDLLVSCGMDKKVHLWDLTTLRYKATRTGHRGGVTCLAFDNRSLLFAGGFDFNIICWDLDAEIDRPIFQLWGHESVVTRIIAVGSINRAFSVDASGHLRLWDSSKSNPNDKEARQIDEVHFTEDTFRCVDVLRNVSANFSTANRVIITTQGRRNHVYKLVDMAPLESAPLPSGVFFSLSLLMLITVHSKDVLFFSAVTGSEQNKLDRDALGLEASPGNDLQVGVLDDRERKLILGDAAGCISVYNCLSGVRLKTLATQVPFACRFMLYTPEKILVAIAGPGELYIFDELPNFPTSDTTMRDTRAHEVDVVAMAYSFELGLIATADCTGTVCIWSFEFVTLEAVIPDCTGTDIGQIAFIGKFPLLLVTDSHNNFSIISVGPALGHFGKTIWRVECDVFVNPLCRTSNAADLSILDLNEEQLAERIEDDVRKQDHQQHPYGAGGTEGGQSGEDEEEAEELGGGKRPLTKKEITQYLRQRRDCKSMTILVQKSAWVRTDEATAAALADPNTAGTDLGSREYRLDQLLGACNPNRPVKGKRDEAEDEASDAAFWAAVNGTKAYDPDDELKEKAPQGATVTPHRTSKKDSKSAGLPGCLNLGFPTHGVRIFAICGYDDGSVTVTDLTPAMRDIGLAELQDHEFASNQPSYDPRRYANRKVNDFLSERTMWGAEVVSANERFTSARLGLVLNAHGGAVTTVKVMSDHDLLTGGADQGVYLWTLGGKLKGTLTRGREWDKLFRPRWITPVDMASRERQRSSDARLLVDFLGLQSMMKKRKKRRPGEKEKELVFGEAESADGHSEAKSIADGAAASGHYSLVQSQSLKGGAVDSKAMLKRAMQAVESTSGDGGSPTHHKNKHEHAHTTDQSVVSLMSAGDDGDGLNMNDEPDRSRVVGQLRGRVTYHMSTKDAAREMMQSKQAESAAALENIGKTKRKVRRVRRGGGFGLEWDILEDEDAAASGRRPKVEKSVAAKYLDDLMSVSSTGESVDGLSKDQLAAEAAKALGQGKPRKIRTKYDLELAQLDADDPNNWEIHSSNRQRALYHRLYTEMDKKGYTKDPLAIYAAKLDALSPGGDFRQYLALLHEEREQKRRLRLGLGPDDEAAGISGAEGQGEDGTVRVGLRVDVSVVDLGAAGGSPLRHTIVATDSDHGSGPAHSPIHSPAGKAAAPDHLSASSFLSTAVPSLASRPASPLLQPPQLSQRPPPPLSVLSPPQHLALPAIAAAGGAVAAVGAKRGGGADGPSSSPIKPQSQSLPQSPTPTLANSPAQTQTQTQTQSAGHGKPSRLTPAQLAAIQEREAVLALTADFDAKLRASDRAARAASKRVKKAKLEYRKLARSASESQTGMGFAGLGLGGTGPTSTAQLPPLGGGRPDSPSQQHQHSSQHPHPQQQHHHPMSALLQSLLSVDAAPAPHPDAAPSLPNTRHAVATLLRDKQASIDGVMEVSRRQKEAEQAWVRKAKAMLAAPSAAAAGEGAGGRIGRRRRGNGAGAGGPAAHGVSAEQSISEASVSSSVLSQNRSKQQKLDKKISERPFFGPYATKELLALLKAFQSLPQVYVPPVKLELPSQQPQAHEHGHRHGHADGEGDEFDEGWSDAEDEPIEAPGSAADAAAAASAAFAAADSAAAGEGEDPAAAAAREEERLALEAHEAQEAQSRASAAERLRQEEEEARAEEHYSQQVLATSIKLQGLSTHPFMKLRPAMKAAVDKYIASRGEDGTLPHNVVCALCDLPAACCPLIKPDDRRQLLRLFVLNTPSQDVAEAAERGVTVQQLQKLRDYYKFFDADNSGGIDKEEITAVLVKLQENSGGGKEAVSEELIGQIMGNSGDELSFDDFARIFRGLVQGE